MDQGTLGAIATVLVAVAFAGVCWWAFSPRRKKRFDEAANLPFADDDDSDLKEESPNSGEQNNQADHHAGDETDRRN
ncbi:cbb3-type cytochrome oxidase subunit 3 [Marinimicrobium sp. ARAG 43.8]|uniref:cbb3-type cytochrome oxidase subunit 3 n=1 Tax=Marinimicrobium sp. ARAG 43.8 TaxID=3418719 RepID=UPI003CEEC131